ncbi:MAG: OsmC-like protein [Gaiellaceae bacterium]|jgi:organic hydroperoxide reductase OsmC/OhrA|nr:OsmC-like protein [Gaiellaceae bacterium]
MPTPPILQFDITVDPAGDAHSALGGSPLPREAEWWAEHLVLAGLVRCTLASLDYSARRAGVDVVSSGSAHGVVTKRADDGLHALVEIETTLEVQVTPALDDAGLRGLLARAEHGCFVSNSLIARPRHRWIVNGEEIV